MRNSGNRCRRNTHDLRCPSTRKVAQSQQPEEIPPKFPTIEGHLARRCSFVAHHSPLTRMTSCNGAVPPPAQ
jgi:hypothetical protein